MAPFGFYNGKDSTAKFRVSFREYIDNYAFSLPDFLGCFNAQALRILLNPYFSPTSTKSIYPTQCE